MLFNDIEEDLIKKSKFINVQVEGLERMVKVYRTLLGRINVLSAASSLISPNASSSDQENRIRGGESDEYLQQPLLGEGLRFSYMGGVIRIQDQMSFKRLVFRATRGKAYATFFKYSIPIQDRMKGVSDDTTKLVYVIMFEEGGFIRQKVQKLCASTGEAV